MRTTFEQSAQRSISDLRLGDREDWTRSSLLDDKLSNSMSLVGLSERRVRMGSSIGDRNVGRHSALQSGGESSI